MTTIE